MTRTVTRTATAPSLAQGRTWGRTRGRAFDLGGLIALWRQRRALARLDDRALADIGVTRAEALAEAARPVWDVPATWRD